MSKGIDDEATFTWWVLYMLIQTTSFVHRGGGTS